MDSKKFDELVKKVSQQITRRSLVKESLGAAALAALGITEEALAKAKNNRGKGQATNRGGKKDNKARGDGKARGAGRDNSKNRDKNKKDNKPQGGDEEGGAPPADTGDEGDVPPADTGDEGGASPPDTGETGGEEDSSDSEGDGEASEPVAAQARRRRKVQAEACIPTGKRCPAPKPRGKKKKKLGCNRCCQRFSIATGGGKRKCACKPAEVACSNDSQCCSGVCDGGTCLGFVS